MKNVMVSSYFNPEDSYQSYFFEQGFIHLPFEGSFYEKYNNHPSMKEVFPKYTSFFGKFFGRLRVLKTYFKKHPDIKTVVSLMYEGNNIVIIAKVLGIIPKSTKVVGFVRNNPDKIPYSPYGLLNRMCVFILYRYYDKIVTNTPGIKNILINKAKCKNVYAIPNGFDVVAMKKQISEPLSINERKLFSKKFVYVTAGKLDPQKGYPFLFHSFKKVVKKHPDSLLLIFGKGPDEDELKKMSKKLGLGKSIIFAGYKKNILSFIKKSDVFVFSSLWESFGKVLVEAIACNIPVLSTDYCYGSRDILDPSLSPDEEISYPFHAKYGIITERFPRSRSDSNKLLSQEKIFANMMIALREDKELRKKYIGFKNHALLFDIKKMKERLEDVKLC